MHADTQQLIALRDGEPVDAAVRRHAGDCHLCQRELNVLRQTRARLCALPPVAPPPPSARVLRAGGRASRRSRRPVYAALVASLAVATALSTWLGAGNRARAPVTSVSTAPASSPGHAASAALQRRSAALERQWRALSQFSGSVRRVGYETGTEKLKTRLLTLDAEHLAATAGDGTANSERYWDRRVRLLDSLVDIQRAELLTRSDGSYRIVRAAAPRDAASR